MKIEEDVLLKEYTTFKLGGPARFFAVVTSVEELKEARTFAHQRDVPFFVLGGGSNIVVADEGYAGLVIKNEIAGVEFMKESPKEGYVEVEVGAGEVWDTFVELCVNKGVGGVENLSGIPGTVGAAPVQNIGAYGAEVKNVILKVVTFDMETGEEKIVTNDECHFLYRDSIFKKPEGKKYIITKVHFLLSLQPVLNTTYKDITAYLHEHSITTPTLADLRNATLSIRAAKLPSIKEYGTAGSFFKNPIILKTTYEALLTKYPGLPSYELKDKEYASIRSTHIKIPLAWILDNVCGFKGLQKGKVGIYKNQALVLINSGGATAQDVQALAHEMTVAVAEKTGIHIEREVEYVSSPIIPTSQAV